MSILVGKCVFFLKNRIYFAYCVVKVRLVVQHEEVQDLESPGLEPVAVAPERRVVQHGTLRPEVGVDGGDVILLGSVGLEEMSDLLQAEGMNPMSHSAVERREVHAVVRKNIGAGSRLILDLIALVGLNSCRQSAD